MTYLERREKDGIDLSSYIVELIDGLRKDQGWTKARLADEAEMDPESISQILRGVRPFSFEMAERLFKALGR